MSPPLIIAFMDKTLTVRGTTTALYDYADWNERILGNKSIIMTIMGDECTLLRFYRRFPVIHSDTMADLHRNLVENNVDIIYIIKHGEHDGIFFADIPCMIHCVFDASVKHGDVYIPVSRCIADKSNLPEDYPIVPHMISLVSYEMGNLRHDLGIPDDAVVFGRYGGLDTFNELNSIRVISLALSGRRDVYFLYNITTSKKSNIGSIIVADLLKSTRAIEVGKFSDIDEKQRFINTCDAFLEIGILGHSFGLAIGEFSVNNKPTILMSQSPDGNWNNQHIRILRNGGIYYRTPGELYTILMNFKKGGVYENCYTNYTPTKVMKVFDELFIHNPAIQAKLSTTKTRN